MGARSKADTSQRQHLSSFAAFFLTLQNQEVFDFYGWKRDLAQRFFWLPLDFEVNEREIDVSRLWNEILRLRLGKAGDSKVPCILPVNCAALHPLRHPIIFSGIKLFNINTRNILCQHVLSCQTIGMNI